MTVMEYDKVEGSAPPVYGPGIRVRVVRDLGGSESARVVESVEKPTGRRRLVLRRRSARRTGTYLLDRGKWYKIAGVSPMAGSRIRDVAFLEPDRPDGRLLDYLVDDNGEYVVDSDGERIVA